MKWIRGEEIGRGGFASVNRAIVLTDQDDHTPSMAVKSCSAVLSNSLKNEKTILDRIGNCPQIIRCFGDDTTVENGEEIYNLILEFAPNGTLADQIKKSHGAGLSETDIRRHARAILEGLSVVHAKGFVHCDIKPQNILLFDDGAAKIADFGMAKERGAKPKKNKHCKVRGTPQYLAPESVNEDEYEPPCDVWALGCVVAEMATGRMAWNHPTGSLVWTLLIRIAREGEVPEIPWELSEEGRDFLRKCLVRDPAKRWTVEMLLKHAFVADDLGSGRDYANKFLAAVPSCLNFCWELVSSAALEPLLTSTERDDEPMLHVPLAADDAALQLVGDHGNMDSLDYGFLGFFFLFNLL